jgi:hypothetical protein
LGGELLDKVCPTERKCAKGFKEHVKIPFDDFFPKGSYRAVPSTS